jgi:hypothetical protein
MGCFTDQVKLTRALVKLLGEHEEELS